MTAYSILYRIRPQVLTSHEIATLKYVFYITVLKYYSALKINAPTRWKRQIFQNKNHQKMRASYLKFKQSVQMSEVEFSVALISKTKCQYLQNCKELFNLFSHEKNLHFCMVCTSVLYPKRKIITDTESEIFII